MEIPSVMVFTWNTQSVRLAESLDPMVVSEHRTIDSTTWRYQSAIPDFMESFFRQVRTIKPRILVVGFQEDVRPGSYVHSHLLPTELPKLGYKLYSRTAFMGLGRTTFNGLIGGDVFVRGLRLSVYIDINSGISLSGATVPMTYSPNIFRNKGAVGIYIPLPNQEALAIINAHLPFDPSSLTQSKIKYDQMIRNNGVLDQDKFYNEMYRHLILDAPAHPTHIILMGDLNYRVDSFVEWSAQKSGQALLEADPEQLEKLINQHDQLRQQLTKGNIYPLLEGVDNRGPTFPPTCKLKPGRDPHELTINSYKLGKHDQRTPSYTDRILHSNNIECSKYYRYDEGVMAQSDHAGVIGIYTLKK